MKLLIAISGGIAAYKVLDVISVLKKHHEIKVITTNNALNFVTPYALNVISDNNLVTETPGEVKHIELAKWCDAFILIPATANTIVKLVYGLADNLVTTTFLALAKDKDKIIFPAMNTQMYHNSIDNIMALNDFDNTYIIEPEVGLLACGDVGIGKLPKTKTIIDSINWSLGNYTSKWLFPLKDMHVYPATNDSFSHLHIDWTKNVEIPIYPHCGSFGAKRKHDIHKGIDLYAPVGEIVYAVEYGYVVDICPFTGPHAGFDWWENTWGVYIKGNSGIVVYGEIEPNTSLKIGDYISKGEAIGTVLKVLKHDKGRPISMLHLELHDVNHIHTEQWKISEPNPPEGILDPTDYLLRCYDYAEKYLNIKYIE